MAYFGALRYFLDVSGGPEVLNERGVLAPGSLNGFLKGNISTGAQVFTKSLWRHFRHFMLDNF
jgi:hypothetical protein